MVQECCQWEENYVDIGWPYLETSSDFGKGKAKSMNDFKQVIDWHGTKAAERQYDGHDNIMHRMYGGVPGAGAY